MIVKTYRYLLTNFNIRAYKLYASRKSTPSSLLILERTTLFGVSCPASRPFTVCFGRAHAASAWSCVNPLASLAFTSSARDSGMTFLGFLISSLSARARACWCSGALLSRVFCCTRPRAIASVVFLGAPRRSTVGSQFWCSILLTLKISGKSQSILQIARLTDNHII